MKNFLKEKNVHLIFEISLVLKGLHAIIEIVGGIATFFITKAFLVKTVLSFTQDELINDPHDFVANYLVHAARDFSIDAQHFIALYLLVHGVVKVFLIAGLLREKMWAYPLSLTVFGAFIVYQLVTFASTHSLWLIFLTLLDLIVIILTWHEYRYKKSYLAAKVA
jgi:uncharacterized membrane protein